MQSTMPSPTAVTPCKEGTVDCGLRLRGSRGIFPWLIESNCSSVPHAPDHNILITPSKARETIFQMPKPQDKILKDRGTRKRRVTMFFMFLLSFLRATRLQFLHSSERPAWVLLPHQGSIDRAVIISTYLHMALQFKGTLHTHQSFRSLSLSFSFLPTLSLEVNVWRCLTIQSPLLSTSRPFPESSGSGIRPEVCLRQFLSRTNGIILAHESQGASVWSNVWSA